MVKPPFWKIPFTRTDTPTSAEPSHDVQLMPSSEKKYFLPEVKPLLGEIFLEVPQPMSLIEPVMKDGKVSGWRLVAFNKAWDKLGLEDRSSRGGIQAGVMLGANAEVDGYRSEALEKGAKSYTREKDSRAIAVSLTRYESGGRRYLLRVTEDVTSDVARRRASEMYRSLMEGIDDPVYLVEKGEDGKLKFAYANPAYLKRIGRRIDDVTGKNHSEFNPAEVTAEFSSKAEGVFTEGRPAVYTHKSHRDGKFFLRTLNPVKNESGETVAVTVVSKDISDLIALHDVEKTAKSLETLTRTLNNFIGDALNNSNAAALGNLGLGLFILSQVPEETRAAIPDLNKIINHLAASYMVTESMSKGATTYQRYSGKPIASAASLKRVDVGRILEPMVKPVGPEGAIELESYDDRIIRVSPRQKLAYFHEDRIEAMMVEYGFMKPNPPGELYSPEGELNYVERQTEDGPKIYRRQTESAPNPLVVLRYVASGEGALPLERLPPILGRESAVKVALSEVIINAIESISSKKDVGTVSVSAKIVEEEGKRKLAITVSDTGIGMDEQLKEQYGFPFNKGMGAKTSRRIGEGAHIIKESVNSCGGEVDVESEPGKGTAVTLKFQIAERPDYFSEYGLPFI